MTVWRRALTISSERAYFSDSAFQLHLDGTIQVHTYVEEPGNDTTGSED